MIKRICEKENQITFFLLRVEQILCGLSCRTTEQTFTNYHNESIVWTVGAMAIFATIQGCSNEVGSRILTATIDVVVFEIVAHYDPIEGVDEEIRCQYQWVMGPA